MLISIIIPIYNVEKYLIECIESILEQNENDIEIILVNDGSTDNSGKIAEDYARKVKNIKFIHKKNGGLSSARNAGLEMASGEFVLFIDSDDSLFSQSISKIKALIRLHKPELIYFSGIKTFDIDGHIELYGNQENIICDSGVNLYNILRKSKNYYTGVYYQCIKRKVLIENNITFYEGILHEDHLYTFRVFMSVNKCIATDEQIYKYRIRENSIMTEKPDYIRRFEAFAITFNEMQNIYNNIVNYFENNIELKKEVNNHINWIGWLAVKSYLRISDNNLCNIKNKMKDFKIAIRKRKERSISLIIFYYLGNIIRKCLVLLTTMFLKMDVKNVEYEN